MNLWDVLRAGQVAHLLGALIVSVVVAVGLLVAIGIAEARSRRGEAERVAAIRQTLQRERQLAGRGNRGRS